MDVLWLLLAAAVCAGLFYLSYRIEPHWVSKDGQRFMCTMQSLGKHDVPDSRIREVRGRMMDDSVIRLDQKQTMRRTSSMWEVVGRSPLQARGKTVFTVRRVGESAEGGDASRRAALRLPAKSSLVAEFDRRAATKAT